MMICPVCGKEFEPHRKNAVTCGDKHCQYENHRRYGVDYQRRRRERNPEAVREYNRKWMIEHRKKQLGIAEPEKEDTIVGEGYAERQMAKTLAMAGKVRI